MTEENFYKAKDLRELIAKITYEKNEIKGMYKTYVYQEKLTHVPDIHKYLKNVFDKEIDRLFDKKISELEDQFKSL